MNKRLLFNLIILITLLSIQIPVFAGVRQTEIRVKPGGTSVRINQYSIPSKSSFYKNGVLMVPLRLFADLMGANLEFSSGGKTVIVVRNNKNVKFIIDKNFIYNDGVKKETASAPINESGTLMIPLRALAEGFNGVISKDSSTSEIVTRFPFENYEKRFAYIKDGVVGDSYYGWSVLFPKGCVIDDKKPSGSSVLIKNIAKGYYYYIFNTPARTGMDDSKLLQELESYVSGEKIVSKNLVKEKNRQSAHLVLESKDEIYEYKAILKNGRLYQIHFYTVDKQGFFDEKQGKIYRDIINSFNVDYSGSSAGITDINEINNGIYTFRDYSCGWGINVPAETKLEVEKSDYSFEILDENGRENGLTVGVDISRLNQGETLEQYSIDQIDTIYKNVSKECISGITEKNTNINGKPAKKIYYKINFGDKSISFFNAVIFDKQSKFHIYVYGESRFFEGEKIDLGDRIIQSFLLPENPLNVVILKGSEKKSNDMINYENGCGWKLKYPANWTKSETGSGFLVHNDSGLAEFQIIQKGSQYSNDNIKEEYGRLKGLNVIEETVNIKGFPSNMISFECDIDDLKYYYSFFVFKVNEKSFLAGYKIAEISKSEENLKVLNDIMQSLEFSFAIMN